MPYLCLSFLDALAVDVLEFVGRRRQAAHADTDKVAVLSVGLDPLRDQLLVGQAAGARVDGLMRPGRRGSALITETHAMQFAACPGRVTKQVNVWLPIGQPALGDFEDLVRYRRCLIKDVEGGRGRGMLPGEGFGVLFLARLRRAEPGFLVVAVIQAPGRTDEPRGRQAQLVPFLNGSPGLGFQLRERSWSNGEKMSLYP